MGVSEQTGLPDDLNKSLLWNYEIQGGGVPVIAGGKAYQFGYYGVEDELQEALAVIEKLRQQLKEKERTDIVQQNTSTNNGDALSNTDGANFPLGLPSLGFADMLHVLRYVSTQ